MDCWLWLSLTLRLWLGVKLALGRQKLMLRLGGWM